MTQVAVADASQWDALAALVSSTLCDAGGADIEFVNADGNPGRCVNCGEFLFVTARHGAMLLVVVPASMSREVAEAPLTPDEMAGAFIMPILRVREAEVPDFVAAVFGEYLGAPASVVSKLAARLYARFQAVN